MASARIATRRSRCVHPQLELAPLSAQELAIAQHEDSHDPPVPTLGRLRRARRPRVFFPVASAHNPPAFLTPAPHDHSPTPQPQATAFRRSDARSLGRGAAHHSHAISVLEVCGQVVRRAAHTAELRLLQQRILRAEAICTADGRRRLVPPVVRVSLEHGAVHCGRARRRETGAHETTRRETAKLLLLVLSNAHAHKTQLTSGKNRTPK
eukprot:scaffold28520_cov124-Isochrysis_galbana.AAC.8